MLDFAERHADRSLIALHYLHLGQRQARLHFGADDVVPLKKAFYALRPAAVLRWMRHHPERRLPPMHFPTLMAGGDPPAEIREMVDDLLRRKAVTHELGHAVLPTVIRRFVEVEFEEARRCFGMSRQRMSMQAGEEADAFFLRWVEMGEELRRGRSVGSVPPLTPPGAGPEPR